MMQEVELEKELTGKNETRAPRGKTGFVTIEMNCRDNINELSKELKWTIILRPA